MPSVILIKVDDNPVPDGPGKWYARQPVIAYQQAPAFDQHFFGYQEMPVIVDTKPITVQALNNRNPNSYKKFTAFTMLNSGVLDRDLNNLTVESDDVVVRQNDGIFYNYGPADATTRAIGADENFYHQFEITDQDLVDIQQYAQPVYDNTDPENTIMISRSKYLVTQDGMDALASADGWLEGPWSQFEPFFEDQYP